MALAIAAGALAAATPAFGAAPSGADFTQDLPAVETLRPALARSAAIDGDRGYGYLDHGPVLYRSAPVRAPERFDLVGVAGETHALEYRTRRDGRPWTNWVEADNGDPVYAGGADLVQVRSRGVPISGVLHYVSVDDGTVPASRLAARGSGGTGPGGSGGGKSGGGKKGGKGGKGLPPQPTFISRAQWGANATVGGCIPRATPETGRIKAGVIHHTVSTNTYTQAEAPGPVLGICRYHRNANGWNDIGYNALVDRFGNLYEGRAGGLGRAVIGAQAEGINSQTTGIASIGDNREKSAGPKEVKSIVKYLAWKFGIAGIPATGRATLTSAGGSTQRTPEGERMRVPRIFPHMETNFTECAGAALNAQVPKIRRKVARRLGG